jgi:hypothetical protein
MRRNHRFIFRLVLLIGAFCLVYIYFSVNDSNSVETENVMIERKRNKHDQINRKKSGDGLQIEKPEENLPRLKVELDDEFEVFIKNRLKSN